MVKIWYIKHNKINVLVIFTNTLKCTNVESTVKLNTKKVVFYMNTHSETFTPLVCSVIDDALFKATTNIP